VKRTRKVNGIAEAIKEEEEVIDQTIEFIPSGSTVLDLILGGGYPIGRIVNIVGDKSTGKTLLASECIAQARKEHGDMVEWFYDDAEAGYTFNSQALYGFEIMEEEQTNSLTVEDFNRRLNSRLDDLEEGRLLIYVLDCLDALSSEAEMKRKQKEEATGKSQGSYNLEKQKFMSEFFRLMANKIKEKRCLLIVISQVRTNIAAYGPKHVRTGGKALDFYGAQINWLAEVEKQGKKGRPIGVAIKVSNTKNKVGLPYREGYVELLFDYGVDELTSNLMFLYDLKTDKGKNKTGLDKKGIKWNNKAYSLRGLIRHIESRGLEETLRDRVIDKWQELEDAISSKGRKSKWQ